SARCARGDFGDRAAELYSTRARARQGVRRGMACDRSGRSTGMNVQPEIGGRAPPAGDVEGGERCCGGAGGGAESQPFCDGSHKGTAFSPVEWKAEQAEQTWFCACKRTGNRPMCDGSHKKLAP